MNALSGGGRFGPAQSSRFAASNRTRLATRKLLGELGLLAGNTSPIITISLLNMALAVTDILMIARFDTAGIAAVVVVSDLYSIIFNFSAGFAGVVTPHVARALGAGVRWQVCTIVKRSFALVVLLTGFGATAIFFAGELLAMIGTGSDQHAVTAGYGRYMAGAYAFMVLFALGRNVLSAMGRSRFALIAIIVAVPLNIVLNLICMYGGLGMEGLGIVGAGAASLIVAIAMGGSSMLFIFGSRSFADFIDPDPTEPIFDRRQVATLARSGGLMGCAALVETGGFLFSTILVGSIASGALAAHTLAFRAMSMFYLLVAAVGQALTIRIAFLHGKESSRTQVHAMRAGAVAAVAIVCALITVLLVGAQTTSSFIVATLQSEEIDLVGNVATLLPMTGLALAAAVPAHFVCAILRAKGEVLVPVVLLAVGHWVVGLPAMFVMGAADGVEGVWMGLLCGAAAASIFALVYLRTQHLRERRASEFGKDRSSHLVPQSIIASGAEMNGAVSLGGRYV